MSGFFNKLVIACHVSAWNAVTSNRGVRPRNVIMAGSLARFLAAYYYLSIFKSGINGSMKYLAIVMCFIALFTFGGFLACVLMNICDGPVKMINERVSVDLHLKKAYWLQTFRAFPCLLSWVMVVTVLFSGVSLNNRVLLNLIFSFIALHTVTAFFGIGLALVGKGPPKKREEKESANLGLPQSV